MWAVFNAKGTILAQFSGDCGRYDAAGMADAALARDYTDEPGAFVAEVCTRHHEPLAACTRCSEQIDCPRCAWPLRACPQHR
ncbi:hypothetical protein [Streptomyces sp. AV19]|uniref:hypothetical protein n=2 Tax=Streptomyces sp. AV19 TaxID=2793068 RepID=UPI00241371DF|nr:hypothetical protein [Streptomyces sp. AV19]MDG4531635.1 hypothetical protein [Streptomyces sp. AV19]